MAFKKKGAPSAKSLNDAYGVANASQRAAGNSVDVNSDCYGSGLSPVNSSGQVTDKQGTPMDWPYQGFTTDNEISPRLNQFPPPQLSGSPATYKDTSKGPRAGSPHSPTLG